MPVGMDLPCWKLRDILRRQQWTQAETVAHFGVRQSTISRTQQGLHVPKGPYRQRIDADYRELFRDFAHPLNPLPALMTERLVRLPPDLQSGIFSLIENALTLAEAAIRRG